MDGRISNLAQVASLTRYTISEGEGRGLDVLDCNNGTLRFLINLSRGADVMQLYHKGENVSFVSKNGFNTKTDDFLSRFEGGMLYTCGLDSVGGREGYELHGKHHLAIAHLVRAEVDEGGIVIEAVMRESALFGKSLFFRRKITSAIHEETLHIEDILTNEDTEKANYCLLYHINIGYPMLDEGAKLSAELLSSEPRTPWAKENADTMLEMSAPSPRMEECCYFWHLRTPRVTLYNPKNKKRFSLTYSGDTLPEFVEWKSMASGDYALGLEPSTTKLDDGFIYRTIEGGESIRFYVKLTVREG